MSLTVTILGTSAMYATAERAASGYLVEVGRSRLWLDAGSGTWPNLLRVCDHESLDAVVLTHRHPDHTSDVFQAEHARLYGPSGPLDPIPIWAPAEALERLRGFAREMDEAFLLRELEDGASMEVGGAILSFVRMAHPPVTLGVRVDSGDGVLAYSADSGEDADFTTLAGGADLFICEATFQDRDDIWHGHLRASQAGAIAARAQASRLLLSHLPPGRDVTVSLTEAQRACEDIPCSLAVEGERLEVRA